VPNGIYKYNMDEETENIISLEDSIIIDESSSVIATRRSSRNQSKTSVACAILCEYPVGTRNSVTVSIKDYATLKHDTFLNDIIIDFYLTFLSHNILPIESQDCIHIFSTMFYKRLLQSPKKNAKKVADYETDLTLSSAEKRHFRVAGWTKHVDLFSKDLVIVPICEHDHWYLVVIIRPGLIVNPVKSEERILKGEPFVLVLDSIGGTKSAAVTNIRHYLAQCEWRKKKCTGEEPSKEFDFTAAEMRTIRPRKPEQQNGSDCGIFLLQYVENIFIDIKKFFWPNLPDLSNWFTHEEVGEKRGNIAEIIKVITNEQRPEMSLKVPNIKFRANKKPVRSTWNEELRPEKAGSKAQMSGDGSSRSLRVTRSWISDKLSNESFPEENRLPSKKMLTGAGNITMRKKKRPGLEAFKNLQVTK